MSWLSTGTAKVVNGSTRVEFAGVDLIANKVQAGDAFAIRGSFNNEIARIVSATVLELVYPWISASADGAAYTIQPTVARLNDLTIDVGELLRTFTDVRDIAGRGMFGDGTAATPGLRFIADQDTGVRRYGENAVALVTGGLDRIIVGANGLALLAHGYRPGPAALGPRGEAGLVSYEHPVTRTYIGDGTGYSFAFSRRVDSVTTDLVKIDDAGNLLVGSITGSTHRIRKDVGVNAGITVLEVMGSGAFSATFHSVSGGQGSSANAAVRVATDAVTNRSINAGGTINASGADYAEYMVKAAGCGIIAKGDVCGVDRDGKLTKTWADAISFVIKSTDPSLVGGDTWDAEVGPKPEQPSAEPVEPTPPAPPAEGADDAMIAAWRDAMAAHPAQVASYQMARAEWQQAMDAYAKALPVWEAAHEKARQCVDRIAFCGQVPANVSGDFEVGDYIIAAASGAGIKAVAVKPDDMTLAQYMRRIGKVWAIRDGRAWIDVQHG